MTLVNSAGTFLESLEFPENPSDSKTAPALYSAGTFLESLEFPENPSDSKKAPALLTSVKNQPSQNHENPTLRVLVQETSGNSKGDETTKNNSLLFGNQYKC